MDCFAELRIGGGTLGEKSCQFLFVSFERSASHDTLSPLAQRDGTMPYPRCSYSGGRGSALYGATPGSQ
jgi:hypothetical protein